MYRFALVIAVTTSGLVGGCKSTGGDDANDIVIGEYALNWGPVTATPSLEATQCIWLRLGNDSEIKVHQMHNVLGSSSHHLIVYKDDMDTVEQTTPVPCQPFTGALNATGKIFPMMITQKHDDELTLPHAVAYTLAPHQMIKIDCVSHVVNILGVVQHCQRLQRAVIVDGAGAGGDTVVKYSIDRRTSASCGIDRSAVPAGSSEQSPEQSLWETSGQREVRCNVDALVFAAWLRTRTSRHEQLPHEIAPAAHKQSPRSIAHPPLPSVRARALMASQMR